MNAVRFVKHAAGSATGTWPQGWRSMLTHTHLLGGELRPPEVYRNLVDWTAARGVHALGVGSPFLAETLHDYRRYEDAERHVYYSGAFDPETVKRAPAVAALIAELNRLSGGRTCFYLDNETPKARYGHMWWVGWHHDFPEWHDYDQPFDRWISREQAPGDAGPEPMPYERRPYMQIVAGQRRHGALGVWAHPTSWWRTPPGAFMTNIASEMPAHLAAEGFIDGLVIMGYDAYRPSCLALWFHLLDRGYPVPGFAETDLGLSSRKLWDRDSMFLTWVPAAEPVSGLEAFRGALQRREIVVSSGPVLGLQVDGRPVGSVVPTGADRQHTVAIHVQAGAGTPGLGRIELLGKGAQRLWALENPEPGDYILSVPGSAAAGYLVAQAFGRGDLPEQKAAREIKQFAVTNPVYLHPAGYAFPRPRQTTVTVRVAADTARQGGRLILEDPAGDPLEQHRVQAGTLTARVPANSRIRLVPDTGPERIRYLINANPEITALQRYLYRGQFLKDYSQLEPGNVPTNAFRLDEFESRISVVELEI